MWGTRSLDTSVPGRLIWTENKRHRPVEWGKISDVFFTLLMWDKGLVGWLFLHWQGIPFYCSLQIAVMFKASPEYVCLTMWAYQFLFLCLIWPNQNEGRVTHSRLSKTLKLKFLQEETILHPLCGPSFSLNNTPSWPLLFACVCVCVSTLLIKIITSCCLLHLKYFLPFNSLIAGINEPN